MAQAVAWNRPGKNFWWSPAAVYVYMSLRDIDPEDRVTMQNHGETV